MSKRKLKRARCSTETETIYAIVSASDTTSRRGRCVVCNRRASASENEPEIDAALSTLMTSQCERVHAIEFRKRDRKHYAWRPPIDRIDPKTAQTYSLNQISLSQILLRFGGKARELFELKPPFHILTIFRFQVCVNLSRQSFAREGFAFA